MAGCSYRMGGIADSEVTLLQQDKESLVLPTDEMIMSNCNGVLHHTPNSEVGIKNIVRYLRPEVNCGLRCTAAEVGSGRQFIFRDSLQEC